MAGRVERWSRSDVVISGMKDRIAEVLGVASLVAPIPRRRR